MPKFPVVKPSDVINILKKVNFIEVRSKGSHRQFKKGNLLVTVPFHSKDLKQQTFKSILRQAKMTVEEFLKLL